MLENKLEQEIIQLYDNNLVNLFSINEISKRLNKKYPYINKKVSALIELGILRKMTVGRSYLCSLNLENAKTVMLLSLNEINKKENEIDPKLEDFLKGAIELGIASVVKSDDTLIFIVTDLKSRRRIEQDFPGCTVVDQEEFVDIMFENPGVFTDHIVMYGFERFFEIIRMSQDELKKDHSPVNY